MTRIPPPVELVVARYQEDISWVDSFAYPAMVYDKSGQSQRGAVCLPNVGREAHTYLTHIVNNYDTLAGLTVFVQGNPFFHLCEDGQAGPELLSEKIAQAWEGKVPFQGLAWFRLKCDQLGRPHSMSDPAKMGQWAGWGRDIPVGELFTKLFGAVLPEKIVARGVTGNFMVTAKRIRTRPRDFYQYALAIIEGDPEDELNTGHAMERLWQFMFNGNKAWNREQYFS